jgi:hypothetical protein
VSWESNEDLLKCVQGSYHIPLYCKKNVGIKGVEVVDGAYGFRGENLPHGDQTLYVGIDPYAEITRSLTNTEMFYPCGRCMSYVYRIIGVVCRMCVYMQYMVYKCVYYCDICDICDIC